MQIEPIVHGLVQGLLVDEQHDVAVDRTVDVLVSQIRGMPRLMCFGMQVLLIVFDVYAILRSGRLFRMLPIDRQRQRR